MDRTLTITVNGRSGTYPVLRRDTTPESDLITFGHDHAARVHTSIEQVVSYELNDGETGSGAISQVDAYDAKAPKAVLAVIKID